MADDKIVEERTKEDEPGASEGPEPLQPARRSRRKRTLLASDPTATVEAPKESKPRARRKPTAEQLKVRADLCGKALTYTCQGAALVTKHDHWLISDGAEDQKALAKWSEDMAKLMGEWAEKDSAFARFMERAAQMSPYAAVCWSLGVLMLPRVLMERALMSMELEAARGRRLNGDPGPISQEEAAGWEWLARTQAGADVVSEMRDEG